jgi:hypothetical protein
MAQLIPTPPPPRTPVAGPNHRRPAGDGRAQPLAAYPHIVGCATCRSYAADYLPTPPAPDVVTAALAYHDSTHRHDPLDPANQSFATF